MKKLFTLFTLLVAIVVGASAQQKYYAVDGTYVGFTTSTNVQALIATGYASAGKSGLSASSRTATINPETDEEIEATSYDGLNVKANGKQVTFYLTNISEFKAYGVNNKGQGNNENRSLKITATPSDASGAVSALGTANAAETMVAKLSDLDPTKEYAIEVGGYNESGSSAADVTLYAVKGIGVASGKVYPTITQQPVGASYNLGDEAQALEVVAEAGGGGALSYQWYSNSVLSTTGATAIAGATESTYTPSTATAGTMYYICKVMEEGADEDAWSAPAGIQVVTSISENTVVTFESGAASDAAFTLGSGMSMKGETKSLDGIEFPDGVKFGGTSSSSNNRFVSFNVAGPCYITVYGKSNSSSSTRTISIGEEYMVSDAKLCSSTDAVVAGEYEYTGDGGTLYLFAEDGDAVLYGVKFSFGNTRSFTATVGTVGYATFSAPYVTAIPEGVTAYTATDGEAVTLTAVEGSVIPANTGVIIAAEAGSYEFVESDVEVEAFAGNDLIATAGQSVTAPTGTYVLAKDEELGAVMAPADGIVIPSFKAYLVSSGSAKAIVIGGATAIEAIEAEAAEAGVKKAIANGKLVIITANGTFNAAGAQVK